MTILYKRFLAIFLDITIIFLCINFTTILLRDIVYIDSSIKFFITFLILFLYFYLMEYYYGQTIGKKVFRIKVIVQSDENKKNIFLKRTIFRFFPFDCFSYLFTLHPILWHDLYSKTYVVSNSSKSPDFEE